MDEAKLLTAGGLKTRCGEAVLGYCDSCASVYKEDEAAGDQKELCPAHNTPFDYFKCDRCEGKFPGAVSREDHPCKSVEQFNATGRVAFEDEARDEIDRIARKEREAAEKELTRRKREDETPLPKPAPAPAPTKSSSWKEISIGLIFVVVLSSHFSYPLLGVVSVILGWLAVRKEVSSSKADAVGLNVIAMLLIFAMLGGSKYGWHAMFGDYRLFAKSELEIVDIYNWANGSTSVDSSGKPSDEMQRPQQSPQPTARPLVPSKTQPSPDSGIDKAKEGKTHQDNAPPAKYTLYQSLMFGGGMITLSGLYFGYRWARKRGWWLIAGMPLGLLVFGAIALAFIGTLEVMLTSQEERAAINAYDRGKRHSSTNNSVTEKVPDQATDDSQLPQLTQRSKTPPKLQSAPAKDQSPFAPSFDCAKAGLYVEKLICSDRELSRLDVEMNNIYKNYLRFIDAEDAKYLKAGQFEWLKRSRSCADKPCLMEAYKKRIAQLKSIS